MTEALIIIVALLILLLISAGIVHLLETLTESKCENWIDEGRGPMR